MLLSRKERAWPSSCYEGAAAVLTDADPQINAFSLFALDCSGASFAIYFALFYLFCRDVGSSQLWSELFLAKVLPMPPFPLPW